MPCPARTSLRRDTLSCVWCPEWGIDSHTSCLACDDFRFSSERMSITKLWSIQSKAASILVSEAYYAVYDTIPCNVVPLHGTLHSGECISIQHCNWLTSALRGGRPGCCGSRLDKEPSFRFIHLPSLPVQFKLAADGGKRRLNWWFFSVWCGPSVFEEFV